MGVVRVRANRRAADEQDLRSGEGLVHWMYMYFVVAGRGSTAYKKYWADRRGICWQGSYVYLVGSGACLSLMAVCDLPSVAAHKRKEGRTIASVGRWTFATSSTTLHHLQRLPNAGRYRYM